MRPAVFVPFVLPCVLGCASPAPAPPSDPAPPPTVQAPSSTPAPTPPASSATARPPNEPHVAARDRGPTRERKRAAEPAVPAGHVCLRVRNADLASEVLPLFERQAGVKLMYRGEDARLTLQMRDPVPWREGLDLVCQVANLRVGRHRKDVIELEQVGVGFGRSRGGGVVDDGDDEEVDVLPDVIASPPPDASGDPSSADAPDVESVTVQIVWKIEGERTYRLDLAFTQRRLPDGSLERSYQRADWDLFKPEDQMYLGRTAHHLSVRRVGDGWGVYSPEGERMKPNPLGAMEFLVFGTSFMPDDFGLADAVHSGTLVGLNHLLTNVEEVRSPYPPIVVALVTLLNNRGDLGKHVTPPRWSVDASGAPRRLSCTLDVRRARCVDHATLVLTSRPGR